MKLREIRERMVAEMSIAHGVHASYWHGTTGEAGRKIARDGKLVPFDVIDPRRTKSRSGLVPQKGKVYLGDLQVGLANAIFRGNMKEGKGEAALVEVDSSRMSTYAPDEDEIADILQAYHIDFDLSLYHSAVRENPVVKAFREKHKVFRIDRDQLHELPKDVAAVMEKAFPIKKPKEYALGQKLVDRYIDGDSRLASRWSKAQRDGDYEHFTWLGKKVLAKIKAGDKIMDDIVAVSTRAAHEGEVPVKRVLVFKTDGLPQNWEEEKLEKLTLTDIEKIAEELKP